MKRWRIGGLETFERMIGPHVLAVSQSFVYDFQAQGEVAWTQTAVRKKALDHVMPERFHGKGD